MSKEQVEAPINFRLALNVQHNDCHKVRRSRVMPALIAPEYAALREVCSAEELAERRARNEQRVREQIEQLGDRYLCHPDNYIRPVPQERGVLYLARR